MFVRYGSENRLAQQLLSIMPCEVFFDACNLRITVYAFGANASEIERLKLAYSDHLDKTGTWNTYSGMTIYS